MEFHISTLCNERWVLLQIEMRNLKDDVISEELRKAGNQYYFRGEFEMALRMYFEVCYQMLYL